MNKRAYSLCGVLLGVAAGVLGTTLLLNGQPSSSAGASEAAADEKEPLYWVAPMDPNYRRDKPGKSPMGMDLIPVYEEGSSDDSPGTVTISPNVENNLGVRTAKATLQPLRREITTVGYVQYDEDRLIHIHPRVEGWVEKLHIKAAGDPVQAGQALYALYSPQLVNAQEELVLALNRNNQRLVEAATNRLEALQLSPGFIRRLKSDRHVRQTVTFYAPQDGVLDNLNIREGFFVKPGTTLMSIGALEEVWVEAEIFERQAALVKPGLPVSMTLDYLPAREWSGTVDYVYPTLDTRTRTARVRLKFNNSDGVLRPNMFAQVVIHTEEDGEHLAIPREAVIRTGNQDRVVLAKGDGRFKSIAVDLGRQNAEFIEIVSGLNEGDIVVTSAQFLLDSESSKTSDFKRMHHGDKKPDSAWVAAEIQALKADQRLITAQHDPIEAWGWPAMIMDFQVADTVDIDELTPGTSLHMEVTHTPDDTYEVTGTHIMSHGEMTEETPASEEPELPSAEVDGVINSVDMTSRQLNITRGPIDKWNRPAATLDFVAAEQLDISDLSPEQKIHFRFHIDDGQFVIVHIMLTAQPKETELVTDHSQHNGQQGEGHD